MSNRKLQEFDQYVYGPRSVLRPGDRFRVTGGPFYQNDDGTKTLMAERGTFTFRRYCEKGASKWIEANRAGGGNVVLCVGKGGSCPDLPSFKRRPYKVRKVTKRQPQAGKGTTRAVKRAKGSGKGGAGAWVVGGAGARNGRASEKRAGRGKSLPSTSGSTSI